MSDYERVSPLFNFGVLYNIMLLWECCIIQWYNTTGIVPQLYIHTHRHNGLPPLWMMEKSMGLLHLTLKHEDELGIRCSRKVLDDFFDFERQIVLSPHDYICIYISPQVMCTCISLLPSPHMYSPINKLNSKKEYKKFLNKH